jgi:non-ribosomal peptide synthetase component E (peptide arylation enzyme)
VTSQPPLCELSGRRAHDPALEDGTARRTWGELDDRTRAIAHGLEQLAPEPGSHVALVSSNRVEFIEVALACLRVGLVYTPIKSSWTPTEISPFSPMRPRPWSCRTFRRGGRPLSTPVCRSSIWTTPSTRG